MDNTAQVGTTEEKSGPKAGLRELNVSIVSADEKVFEDTVFMLTSKNDDGEFDVLPLHTNFITLIKEKIIIHKKGGEKKEIPITNGVLKISENVVNIILGPFVGADILPEGQVKTEQIKTEKNDSGEISRKEKSENKGSSIFSRFGKNK